MGIALAVAAASAAGAPAGTVYTANERDGSITRIELQSGAQQTTRLAVSPHNVQISPDGKRVLAVGVSSHAGHGGGGGAKGKLVVMEASSGSPEPVLLDAGDHPAHVVTDAAGARAFVSDSGANVVHVIDLASQRSIGQVATDRYPHGLRLSPDGKTLYVANMRGGTVSVIDVDSLKETQRIAVGKGPVQVGFSPDGARAFVSLSAENRLGIIDTSKGRLVKKVAVGSMPIQMDATPDGRRVYVANQGTSSKPADTVSVVDPVAGKVVATVTTDKGAHGVAMSKDGRYVFVTNIEAGTLSVIDTAVNQVVSTHRVGAGPNGVTYSE
ncbi:YncE family protein [Caldimonas brevitalea]|uniref:YncE family protein n=1 Tax=Caldimonas brevitalea TaxID=413882 RepID=UPI001EEE533C|nr:YncE family protein [Caldimonas brevitalea]